MERSTPVRALACCHCGSEKIRVELTCHTYIDLVYEDGVLREKVVSPHISYTSNVTPAVCLVCEKRFQIQTAALPPQEKL